MTARWLAAMQEMLRAAERLFPGGIETRPPLVHFRRVEDYSNLRALGSGEIGIFNSVRDSYLKEVGTGPDGNHPED